MLRACTALNAAFAQIQAEATLLAPYAVRFRYPDTGAPPEPPLPEARAAVAAAERVLAFVRGQLGI